MTIGIA